MKEVDYKNNEENWKKKDKASGREKADLKSGVHGVDIYKLFCIYIVLLIISCM